MGRAHKCHCMRHLFAPDAVARGGVDMCHHPTSAHTQCAEATAVVAGRHAHTDTQTHRHIDTHTHTHTQAQTLR